MSDLYRIRVPEPVKYDGGYVVSTALGNWFFWLYRGGWQWQFDSEEPQDVDSEAAALAAIREDIVERLMGLFEPVEEAEP